ncbi:MAG: monofunctional biosynthetic peptidoglycan transglycosylase [Pseudaminobacter sp.]
MDEPIIDPETEGLAMAQTRKTRARRRPGVWWVRRIVLIGACVALMPLLLTVLYIPPFVHPISTLMLGNLATFTSYDRRWVAIDDVAPVMVHSVIMSEDGQFCSHRGIDWNELKVVIDDAMAGESARGASTIPMQTVKNLFLWPGRSVVRKAVEVPLAVYLDAVLTKKRIMEIYLNVAEWGPGIYGVEAAAQYHFGISASRLSARQAALLTVALPNPYIRNPAKPGQGLQRLANLIPRRAARAGGYVGCVS